jgi:fructose-bisphosphate aldolase, class II
MVLARYTTLSGQETKLRLMHGFKMNVNSWARDPYVEKFASLLLEKTPFPEAVELATETFAIECEKLFKVFGSAGKA